LGFEKPLTNLAMKMNPLGVIAGNHRAQLADHERMISAAFFNQR
jgi:hypothetical protein